MASILPVGDRWRAQVRRAGHKSIARTFATRREAEAWARRVESGMDEHRPAAMGDDMRVETLVSEYRRMRATLGRAVDPCSNVHYMLEHLAEDLGPERLRELTPQRLSQWAQLRKSQGAGGYTVNMELSLLGTAIRHVGAFLQAPLPDVVGLARPLLHYAQLIAGGGSQHVSPARSARCAEARAC